MSSVDYGNAPRLQASEVALNPAVAGNTNVQDALDDPGGTGAGLVVLDENGDVAVAETPTTIVCDGSSSTIHCITASPPSWMDDAGNIITPGMYQFVAGAVAGVAPTTPGDVMLFEADHSSVLVPIDGLAFHSVQVPLEVFTVAADNVPFPAELAVFTPTDATATVDVTVRVIRLAYNAGTDPPA